MAKDNPSNPHTRDPAHTAKDVPLPVQKAKVLSAGDHPEDNAFHTVKIRVYGDQAPYIAPVLTPVFGSVWVPKKGQDVAVIFGSSDSPWVIGAWYPLDRVESGEVDLPDYEAGDIILGNENGHIAIRDDGTVETTDTFSSYSDEDSQDAVGNILSNQFTYDDSNDTININPHASSTDAHHPRYTHEEVRDVVANFADGGSNVSLTHNDSQDTLTIDTSALNAEEVDDRVADLIIDGSHLTASYDDSTDTLTLDVDDDWVDESGDIMSGPLTLDDTDGQSDTDGTTGAVTINQDNADAYGIVLNKLNNHPNAPAHIVMNGDSDSDDMAMMIRSNGDAPNVDTVSATDWSNNSVTSSDDNWAVWTDGQTVIGVPNLQPKYTPQNNAMLEVNGNTHTRGYNYQTKGFFDSNLTSTQSNAENGLYVNVADNVNVNRGFTINSPSSIGVDAGGTYRVDFSVNFHRTGSSSRNIMYGEIELNGTKLTDRTRGVCYIRNSGNGDEGDANGSAIMDLSAGDTLRVYADEERGGEFGNDIERANINIEHLG